MNTTKLSGIMPALVTPFDGGGAVNESVLREMVRHHLKKKVDGFYVCGTTGQGIYLSAAERKNVAEIVLDASGGERPVIVHVGCLVPAEAADLAAHAASAGAAGISSILPPTYTTTDAVKAYFGMLAERAPKLPLLPYFMGSPLPPMAVMESLAGISTLAGTKYTGPNMYEMKRIIDMGSEPWSVFSGMDEQSVFGAMCGAHGAIGSSINLMPGVYREIRARVAADRQGEAYDLQQEANAIITILISYGYPAALRAALGFLGFECGTPRLPELPLAGDAAGRLETELGKAGFERLTSM